MLIEGKIGDYDIWAKACRGGGFNQDGGHSSTCAEGDLFSWIQNVLCQSGGWATWIPSLNLGDTTHPLCIEGRNVPLTSSFLFRIYGTFATSHSSCSSHIWNKMWHKAILSWIFTSHRGLGQNACEYRPGRGRDFHLLPRPADYLAVPWGPLSCTVHRTKRPLLPEQIPSSQSTRHKNRIVSS